MNHSPNILLMTTTVPPHTARRVSALKIRSHETYFDCPDYEQLMVQDLRPRMQNVDNRHRSV